MSESPEIDLLTEPIFRVRTTDDTTEASLPELMARLSEGEPIEFAGLQAHQSHPWHAFLCQLAAIALNAAGRSEVRGVAAADWHGMLLALTDGAREPWCLVVPDLAKPAFMQPPVPEGSMDVLKNAAEHPDLIDLLVTAKNHDVKRRRFSLPQAEHWVYALVSVQTSDGFGGRSIYGIVRMNGGYGSRSCVCAAISDANGARFVRDTGLLLATRDDRTLGYGFSRHGISLLWTVAWNGSKALTLADCDPDVIEICRRIRLLRQDDRLVARHVGSHGQRIAADEAHGNLGDPWIPIRRSDGAALTAKGLGYALLQEVLFGADYEPSPASRVLSDDGDTPVFLARLLVRGQGKTEGYFERAIPCPTKTKRLLNLEEGRTKIGSLAKQRVELVTMVRNQVLKPALLTLLQGAPSSLDFKDDRADPLTRKLDRQVDNVFFPALFEGVDSDPGLALRQWIEVVLSFAQGILEEACHSSPLPTARRYKAICAAEAVFYGAARKRFPDNFIRKEGGSDGDSPQPD